MKPSLKLWLAVVGVALGALNFTFTAQAQNQIVGNLTVQTKILDANGTAAAPSYTFTNSPTTGLFRSAADAIGVSTAGVERWTFNASGSLNPLVNNTYDIGNGSVNPRDVYAARSFIGPLLTNAGALTIQSTTAANVTFGYNSTAVLQIDSTSNATVIGTKTLKFGATAAATIGVSADTTAGNLVFTLPTTGMSVTQLATRKVVIDEASAGLAYIHFLPTATAPATNNGVLYGDGTNNYADAITSFNFRIGASTQLRLSAGLIAPDATGFGFGTTALRYGASYFSGPIYVGAASGTSPTISATGSSPTEVLNLINGGSEVATVQVQNTNVAGYSVINFSDNSGTNKMGIGYANASAAFAGGGMYFNTASGVALRFFNGGTLSLSLTGGAASTLTGGAGNMTLTAGTGASRTLTFQTTTSGSTATNAVVIDATQNVNVVTGELQTAGNRVGYNLTVYAAGTAYTITNVAAALDFGTTDPTKVIDKAGTYLIFGRAYLKYNAATYAGTETATIKLRRTNNTAADLTNATTTATLRIITTITDSVGIMELPPVIYTTANTDDSISVFGVVSAAPAAGSVDATEASIVAVRLY